MGQDGQDEQVTQDLGAAGLDRQRLGWARTGDPARGGQRLPLCFQSWEQFAQFQREFAELIAGTLVDGRPITARAELIGSAATFYSGNPKKPPGHHFDKKGAGAGTADIDIWLTSPELALKVAEHPHAAPNLEATLGAERSIFRNKHRGGGVYEQFPAFEAFADRWGLLLNREAPDVKLRLDASLARSQPTDLDNSDLQPWEHAMISGFPAAYSFMEMTDDELSQQVRRGGGLAQHTAAVQLADRGAHDALASIAADVASPISARVTALRCANAQRVATTIGALLSDPTPVIRLVALEKVREGLLREHVGRVEKLRDDAAEVLDLEETFALGVVAQEVLALLRGLR